MREHIRELLRYLGVTANYRGYALATKACELIEEDESLLLCVTRELYPKVADFYGCNSDNVERNIRTMIKRIWDEHPERLIEISRCDLTYQPTVSEFLDYLVTYVQRSMMSKP